MNTHAERTPEHTSHSKANSSYGKPSSGKSTFQFKDNRSGAVAQRKLHEIANASSQAKQAIQLRTLADNYSTQQRPYSRQKENRTGLSDRLKSGIENLSGYSMDDVKVHYHSDQPAQLNAHAYAQGTDIHLGPGQEKHLPHEAWHVVQQKQGRVKATKQLKEARVGINDDAGLEREAEVMGSKALARAGTTKPLKKSADADSIVQRKVMIENVPLKGLYDDIATVEAGLDPGNTLMGKAKTDKITEFFTNDKNIYVYASSANLLLAAGTGNYDFRIKQKELDHDLAKSRLHIWADHITGKSLQYIMNEKFSGDHLILKTEAAIEKSKERFEKENLDDTNKLVKGALRVHNSTWIVSSVNGIVAKAKAAGAFASIASIYKDNQQLNTPIKFETVTIKVTSKNIEPAGKPERTANKNRIEAIKKNKGIGAVEKIGANKYKYFHKDGMAIEITFETETEGVNAVVTGSWGVDGNLAEIYHYSSDVPNGNKITPDNRKWWVSEDEKKFYQPVRVGDPEW